MYPEILEFLPRHHDNFPRNITNNNLHNYSANNFIAILVLFNKTNPRYLFNELASYRITLHKKRN